MAIAILKRWVKERLDSNKEETCITLTSVLSGTRLVPHEIYYLKYVVLSIVELADEAESNATHVGVPAGIKLVVNSVVSLGMKVKCTREKLGGSRWQNCYEEIPMQLDHAAIS